MAHRKDSNPSPVRSGFFHGFVSFAFFGAVTALAGGAIHITGDSAEAGPQYTVALFETVDGVETPLQARLKPASGRITKFSSANNPTGAQTLAAAEPSLGVADPANSASAPRTVQRTASAEPVARGIRINGRLVSPGQSLSSVEQGSAAAEVEDLSVAKPDPAAAPAAVHKYARAFSNPEARPIVSLIVGGLGTSYRQAISAIDDLPSDVTLSFVPDANPSLLRYARQKGHEVLLEVPMESYGYGRTRPHNLTLKANSAPDDNILRLTSLLRGKDEVFGVINHQGEKFLATPDVASPILEHLNAQGLALFQHGATKRGTLNRDAAGLDMQFASAARNIDTETNASFIEAELFKLETEALENGYALGTGFSYPLTVDLIAAWSRRLQAKGILLAPASAVMAPYAEANKLPPVQTTQLAIDGSDAGMP